MCMLHQYICIHTCLSTCVCTRRQLMRDSIIYAYILQRVSVWKRFHVIYAFFFVRKIVAHWVTFFFYCVVIPSSVLHPEIELNKVVAVYIPATITILNVLCTPRYSFDA